MNQNEGGKRMVETDKLLERARAVNRLPEPPRRRQIRENAGGLLYSGSFQCVAL
jgi:hypothetical protein